MSDLCHIFSSTELEFFFCVTEGREGPVAALLLWWMPRLGSSAARPKHWTLDFKDTPTPRTRTRSRIQIHRYSYRFWVGLELGSATQWQWQALKCCSSRWHCERSSTLPTRRRRAKIVHFAASSATVQGSFAAATASPLPRNPQKTPSTPLRQKKVNPIYS